MRKTRIDIVELRDWLDSVYACYHRRDYLGSDPIKFVHAFADPLDQEIAGLIAASLAYGNVTAINASIGKVLERMQHRPRLFIEQTSRRDMMKAMNGFRHRWTDDVAIVELLCGVKRVVAAHGSLGHAFLQVDDPSLPLKTTLGRWVRLIQPAEKVGNRRLLLADPERNSACKRLNLYLRWMVRCDEIDPGCWKGVSSARLAMPLDVHVYRFAKACGMTHRNTADGRTVDELTNVFRQICPDDPVKYDFSLTRPGIIDGWKPGKSGWRASRLPAKDC